MKMVLALQHGVLPRTLHAEEPSPHVDWSSGGIRLLGEPVPWQAQAPGQGQGEVRPRRAGVSSFGISGTNAHVILEEAPPADAPAEEARAQEAAPPAIPMPVLLSARTEAALRVQAERLRAHLEAQPGLELADVAYSLATTRAQLEQRAAVVARDRGELLGGLAALAGGSAVGQRTSDGKLAVLFTGQGSQRATMGRALYEAFPVFRAALDAACACFDADSGASAGGGGRRPLREVMFAAEGSVEAALLDETGHTQPALFALEVALYRQLEAWGLRVDLLLGHSIGELVAAHVAGVLTLADACTLVGARSRLMQALPRGGAMMTVQAPEEAVRALLAARGTTGAGGAGGAAIAAINGPASTVVSGDAEAVLDLGQRAEAAGHKTQRLRVSHAFHSHHMDGMLEAFGRVAERLTFHPARIPIASNVTGRLATDAELSSPRYWVEHVRGAVRFLDGVRALHAEGARTFLELGPHAVLSSLVHDALAEGAHEEAAREEAAVIATLRHGGRGASPRPTTERPTTERPEVETLTAALGALHARGHRIDWAAYFVGEHGLGQQLGRRPRQIALPTYAFQRERFWLEEPKARSERADVASAGLAAADHPLLGAAVALADRDEHLFTGRLSLAEHPWLGHVVAGAAALSGAVLVELALAAAHRVGLERIDELVLEAPLALPARGAVLVQLVVGAPDGAGRRPLTVHARAEDAAPGTAWVRYASGTLAHETPAAQAAPAPDLHAWPPPGATALPLDGLYARLADAGLACGPELQGLRAAWKRGDELFAEAELPEAVQDAARYALHPALLDAALHALAAEALNEDRGSHGPDSRGSHGPDSDRGSHGPEAAVAAAIAVPVALRGLALRAVGSSVLRVRFARTPEAGAGAVALAMADAVGEPVAYAESLTLGAPAAEPAAAPAYQNGHAHTPQNGAAHARVALPAARSRITVAPTLLERLRPLAPEERVQAMLEIVRAHIAQVLGAASSDLVEPHRPLPELGLDSLMSLELRKRLGGAIGLRLPTTLFFEYPTAQKTASELLRQLRFDAPQAFPEASGVHSLAPVSEPPPRLAAVAAAAAPPAPAADDDGPVSVLASQVMELLALQEVDVAMDLLASSARSRRVREARARTKPGGASPARPVQLAHGPASAPPIICVSPTPPVSAQLTYATLATSFEGLRDVWGLTRPGYGPGELLPRDLDEVLAHHVAHVEEITGGGPFVLLSYSSGGWLAHALASHLERLGHRPTALVLLDTYLPRELTPGLRAAFMSWLTRFPLPLTDNEFTAFGSYFFDLLGRWTPGPLSAPTLFFRCMEPLPGMENERVPGRDGWQSSWKDAHTTVEVPFHHYSMMLQHASTTAGVIQDWLADLASGAPLARVGQVARATDPCVTP
jgi:acyl transferase domain-containing protein/acyl carrier protein